MEASRRAWLDEDRAWEIPVPTADPLPVRVTSGVKRRRPEESMDTEMEDATVLRACV